MGIIYLLLCCVVLLGTGAVAIDCKKGRYPVNCVCEKTCENPNPVCKVCASIEVGCSCFGETAYFHNGRCVHKDQCPRPGGLQCPAGYTLSLLRPSALGPISMHYKPENGTKAEGSQLLEGSGIPPKSVLEKVVAVTFTSNVMFIPMKINLKRKNAIGVIFQYRNSQGQTTQIVQSGRGSVYLKQRSVTTFIVTLLPRRGEKKRMKFGKIKLQLCLPAESISMNTDKPTTSMSGTHTPSVSVTASVSTGVEANAGGAPGTQLPTQPPTTPPPTTQPPTTQPQTTPSPATQPPTTQPQTTPSPATQPPTTQPQTTPSPTTQPPTTQAPTTQPPTTQSPTVQSPATTPPITQSQTTAQGFTEPSFGDLFPDINSNFPEIDDLLIGDFTLSVTGKSASNIGDPRNDCLCKKMKELISIIRKRQQILSDFKQQPDFKTATTASDAAIFLGIDNTLDFIVSSYGIQCDMNMGDAKVILEPMVEEDSNWRQEIQLESDYMKKIKDLLKNSRSQELMDDYFDYYYEKVLECFKTIQQCFNL